MIATFLSDYFDETNCSPKVLEGIRSCLSQTFKLMDLIDISHSPAIAAVLQCAKISVPKKVFQLPKWNLLLVLNHLLDPPYEPICDISFKHLTWKTCFLVSLATAARCSEIHALSYSGTSHSKNWGSVWLTPNLLFLAKNQSSYQTLDRRSYQLHSLQHFAGPDLPERRLCPVRALRLYMAKTEMRRSKQGQRNLFISINPSRSEEISKSAVSHWLRQLIVEAHTQPSNKSVSISRGTPHEIRAIASSFAFHHSLGLSDLLQTCTWKSDNVFTSFYLRDVASQFPTFKGFPPCVVAQRVFHPPSDKSV